MRADGRRKGLVASFVCMLNERFACVCAAKSRLETRGRVGEAFNVRGSVRRVHVDGKEERQGFTLL